MNLAVNFWLTAKAFCPPPTPPPITKANNIQNIIGIPSIDTQKDLRAVIAGIIVWLLHDAFHNIRLPDATAFFGGTPLRAVDHPPCAGSGRAGDPAGWPVFAMGINAPGKMINSAGDFGPMIFGTGLAATSAAFRLACPHPGGADPLHGSRRHPRRLRPQRQQRMTIFQAQLSCPTTRSFAETPPASCRRVRCQPSLGGLPGTALAMYHCARPENRRRIKGLLISG